jgi:hypothetical protein
MQMRLDASSTKAAKLLKSSSTPSSAANLDGEPSNYNRRLGATAIEWRREHFADRQISNVRVGHSNPSERANEVNHVGTDRKAAGTTAEPPGAAISFRGKKAVDTAV